MDHPLDRYSLWVMPDEAAAESFRRRIGEFARRFKTAKFEPHLTLVGRVPALSGPMDSLQAFVKNKNAPGLRVLAPETGEGEFRCVYLKMELSSELSGLYRAADWELGVRENGPFMPHISMVYGALPEADKKRAASELEEFSGMVFRARSLWLVDSSGSPKDWKKVREFLFRV